MISFEDLSTRIFQFFDQIYLNNKTDYGFSCVSGESFHEEKINQDIRLSYDYSHSNFITTDLSLTAFKTILVGSRTIDVYMRTVLGKTIAQIPAMTINELLAGLNAILIIDDFYANIDIEDFTLSSGINELLQQAQKGQVLEVNALARLNKMLLCSIYNTQITTSTTLLTPIPVTSILFYRIEDEMLGNGIQSNSISYSSGGNEIIEAFKSVEVVVNILSKKYLAKDATNFLNFAIQSERKQEACYGSDFDFDLILYSKSEPVVLTVLEKGAWLERVEQRLLFKYVDTLQLEIVDELQQITTIDEVKDVYQYTIENKQGE